jgi:hypothetical protein
MTNIAAPQRIRDRMKAVGVQMYHQDKLSTALGISFPYFNAARKMARKRGLIDDAEADLYAHINAEGNWAKHHGYGGPEAAPFSNDGDEDSNYCQQAGTWLVLLKCNESCRHSLQRKR